ncbi:MAG: hypothetical protein MZV70_45585 [Desulfobacterales bacterium]|nr:hypothetical protein [Desulfobacterales bacterium]
MGSRASHRLVQHEVGLPETLPSLEIVGIGLHPLGHGFPPCRGSSPVAARGRGLRRLHVLGRRTGRPRDRRHALRFDIGGIDARFPGDRIDPLLHSSQPWRALRGIQLQRFQHGQSVPRLPCLCFCNRQKEPRFWRRRISLICTRQRLHCLRRHLSIGGMHQRLGIVGGEAMIAGIEFVGAAIGGGGIGRRSRAP